MKQVITWIKLKHVTSVRWDASNVTPLRLASYARRGTSRMINSTVSNVMPSAMAAQDHSTQIARHAHRTSTSTEPHVTVHAQQDFTAP